jgi:phosphoglycolate phosphatase
MTELVIFDLDGTLVDTPRAIVETFTTVFASVGVEPPEPAAIRATIGLPLEQAFGKLLGVAPDDTVVVTCVDRYQRIFRETVLPCAAGLVFPGIADGLAALRGRGLVLAVATSKYRVNAEALLRAAGLRDRFALVVGADDVSRPKPHPETGEVVLRALGLPAADAVMVGDTTHDVLMAVAAGMRSAAVTYGVHGEGKLRAAGPTWIVHTVDELMALLSGKEGAS